MCYQFMDHQSLGYREIISLETLMGAVYDLLEFLYWLKQNLGLLYEYKSKSQGSPYTQSLFLNILAMGI